MLNLENRKVELVYLNRFGERIYFGNNKSLMFRDPEMAKKFIDTVTVRGASSIKIKEFINGEFVSQKTIPAE